jgi:hydroxymethylpyrimidine/phosphomethylpyrimidine kinase
LAGAPVRVVAVGGLDPGGGAGLVRDYLTAEARGALAVLVGTAWTEQSRDGVRGFEPRPPAAVADALRAAVAGADAVKIGMVGSPELASAIAVALGGFSGPVVFDPVLGASSGGALFAGPPTGVMPLVRRATVTTPNLAEAALLTGLPAGGLEEARRAGHALVRAGAPAVLVKGGHLSGAAVDLLVTAEGEQELAAERLPGPSPRGTGCALATALAIELARGQPLAAAAAAAKAWLHGSIRAARPVGDEHHLG